MKIILTGSTGLIGGAVLQRCISHPSITSIIALTRRPMDITHSRLENVVHTDFLTYDEAVLSRLAGAEACIWSLGTPSGGREIHVDYTMAAANAFAKSLAPKLGSGKKFRFIYTSGALVEKDQNKSLWFMGEGRRMRGEIEIWLADFQTQHSDLWSSVSVRPWVVTNGEPLWRFLISNMHIPVEELAAAMVDMAVDGSGQVCMENADLRARGKTALAVSQ